jgi:hypothetical protein
MPPARFFRGAFLYDLPFGCSSRDGITRAVKRCHLLHDHLQRTAGGSFTSDTAMCDASTNVCYRGDLAAGQTVTVSVAASLSMSGLAQRCQRIVIEVSHPAASLHWTYLEPDAHRQGDDK